MVPREASCGIQVYDNTLLILFNFHLLNYILKMISFWVQRSHAYCHSPEKNCLGKPGQNSLCTFLWKGS